MIRYLQLFQDSRGMGRDVSGEWRASGFAICDCVRLLADLRFAVCVFFLLQA
jgi:hypothetical protein